MNSDMDREEWNRRYDASDLLWTAEANRLLVAEVEGMAPGRALDVGTGEGPNAVWLAKRGFEVTAVDFSDVALTKARRLAKSRGVEVEWVLADLREYRPDPRAYDLVIVLYLHLRSEDRRRAHVAAAQALAPGGTLVVIGHDRSNLTEGYGGPQDPTILFSPGDIVDDLAGTPDVAIIRAERAQRTVGTDGGERTAIDAMVRAVRGQP